MRGRSHHWRGGNGDSPFHGYSPRSHSHDRHGERDPAPRRTEHHHLLWKQRGEHGGDQSRTSEQLGARPFDGLGLTTRRRGGEVDADLGLRHFIVLLRGSLENARSAPPYGDVFPQAPQPQQQHSPTSSVQSSTKLHAAEHATVSSASANATLDNVKTFSSGVAVVQCSLTTQLSAAPQDTPVSRPIKETLDNEQSLKNTTAAYSESINSLQHFQAERSFEKLSDGPAPPTSTGVPPLVAALTSTLPVLCMMVCFGIWVRKRGTRSQSTDRHPPLDVGRSHQVAQPLLSLPFADPAETLYNNHQYELMETPPPPRQLPERTNYPSVAVTWHEQCQLVPSSASLWSSAFTPANPADGLPISARPSNSGYEIPLHCNYYRNMVRSESHSPATSSDDLQDVESLR